MWMTMATAFAMFALMSTKTETESAIIVRMLTKTETAFAMPVPTAGFRQETGKEDSGAQDIIATVGKGWIRERNAK